MACEFVCDGCGKKQVGQQREHTQYGSIFVKPAGWKVATFRGRELHACSIRCVKSAEAIHGIGHVLTRAVT